MKMVKFTFSTLFALIEVISFAKADELYGAGASLPAPLYEKWFNDYTGETGNRVNYEAVGSSAGVSQFAAGTVDFGASDEAVYGGIPSRRPMVHIPMAGGAIAIAYNKPGCDLQLSQVQLVRVAYGIIQDWSELGCSGGPITWVHRSDGSGTTAAFTSSLSGFSPFWSRRVGSGKIVEWPGSNVVGADGNSGVASTISSTPGSIGYLNYGSVKRNSLQQASIQNISGNFVTANSETAGAALSFIDLLLDNQLRGADPNPSGPDAFPIVTLTWILAEPGHKTEDMKALLNYMLSGEAQSQADSLGYVPLPETLRQKSLAAVDSL